MDNRLVSFLEKRKENDALRMLNKNSKQIDFSSNDYLGLSNSIELLEKVQKNYSSYSNKYLGSGGSRLLAGNHEMHEELEYFLANVHKGEASLLFNSGYVANMGLLSTIPLKGDTVIYDELIHTCIKDGVRLSNAKYYSFKHNDLESLKKKIALCSGKVYVAVESIYSMDGDEAPLVELVALSLELGFDVIVDEAHASGIYGKGAGLCVELGIEQNVFARVYTFGKGIGTHGACIVGSENLKNFLINFCRPFIYTTSQPLHGLIATLESYKYILSNPEIIEDLFTRINYFKSRLKVPTKSTSAIQPIFIEGNTSVKEVSREMRRVGFDVKPVMSPTVAIGTERLRVCIHGQNTMDEIYQLTEKLNLFL